MFRFLIITLPLIRLVAAAPVQAEPDIDFNDDVRPIFVKHCLACHGGVKQAGGISFVTRELAMAEGDSGMSVIEPGDHELSYLYDRIADPDDDFRMPPPEHGRRLNEAELKTLRQWINQGAVWDKPWAFRAPKVVDPPALKQADWPRQKLDKYVLARLEAEGIGPAAEADRSQWLRRATFDLIGLPPTEDERVAFQTDLAPGAYERAVDRLLASPHFGERWASVWLDLARYADTMGYEKDPNRTIWPWRDWVVNAFNADTPYDEFLLKQTAGDLLPEATLGDRLATAFHRNTQTNTEGGTDDEEYRWSAIVDRVDSTWAGVMGMTMGCARCHDHPYDPIMHEDYYSFAAYFNSTQDADLHEDFPKLEVPVDPTKWTKATRIDKELADIRQRLHEIGLANAAPIDPWQALPIDQAESTGQTRLKLRPGDRGVEIVAEGTVTDRSRYTLGSPATTEKITALRIDAGPKDPETAIAVPEMGFVLSRLRVFVERERTEPVVAAKVTSESQSAAPPSAPEPEELVFAEVFADETNGFFQPIDSIRDNSEGWGPYTRIRNPRWAAFILEEPIELGPNDRLRIELKHDKATDGQGPLVMQRLTVSASDASKFSKLAADSELRSLREREAQLMKDREAIKSVATPVLAEQPEAVRRRTYLFERGNWMSPSDQMQPTTPGELPGEADDRLELGRWFGSDENPLATRVIVNRLWSELFGGGIVETVEDFGSTGSEPSHPELLDYLAVHFREDLDWSIKGMLREIVLSATYRQDARVSADQVANDPTNRLLSRGPRGRLSAEMVRDQALVLSGRFNPKLGGEPVMPYQPDGIWQSVYNNKTWETATGKDRFRRALYTYWKRTAAYPSMVAFDAPSREQCTVRRATTNTPLQALVTLNDPAFIELAEGLADRMMIRQGESVRQQIAWAVREATGHELPDESLAQLERLYEETLGERSSEEATNESDATPSEEPSKSPSNGASDESEDAHAGDAKDSLEDETSAQRFAMTIVANVILNLDATLTK